MPFQRGASGVIAIRPLTALIVGAVVAVTLSFIYRADHGTDAGTDPHALFEAAPRAPAIERNDPVAPADSPSPTERVLAAQAELRDASESFRNSTLLIAIRENGFVCGELTSVEQGGDPLGGWRVACRGALAYFVGVGASGELVVEPVPVGDNLLGRPSQSLPQDQLPNPLTPPNR